MKSSATVRQQAVEHHGWEVADEIETAMQEFDFLARIETPEFPS
jgi:hypothetical protein